MDNLKEAIAKDIETLKQIEVDVMESSLYYKKVKQWVVGIFLVLFITTLLVGALSAPFTDKMFAPGQVAYKFKLYFGLTFVGSILLFFGRISWCGPMIVFKEQILPKLETRDWLINQTKRVLLRGYIGFVVLMFLGTLYFGWPFVGVVMLFSFAVATAVTTNLMLIELNRVGASVLFTSLKDYFQKTARDGLKKE